MIETEKNDIILMYISPVSFLVFFCLFWFWFMNNYQKEH